MFARDVITQQAIEKHLLEREVPMASTIQPVAEEEMTPECAEEFEQNCRAVAPLAVLNLPDLHEQLLYATR